MSSTFPSKGIAKKFATKSSAADGALSDTKTVAATNYGVVYKLWVSIDTPTEADLDLLKATASISITMGSTAWVVEIHPFIADGDATQARTWLDLGPWLFDFGDDGLYSGVLGDDIVVAVDAVSTADGGAGTIIKADYLYSGD